MIGLDGFTRHQCLINKSGPMKKLFALTLIIQDRKEYSFKIEWERKVR